MIDHGTCNYSSREFHAPVTQKRDLEQRKVDFGTITGEGEVELDEVYLASYYKLVNDAARDVKNKAALIEENDGLTVSRKIVTVFGAEEGFKCPPACSNNRWGNYKNSGHSQHCEMRRYLGIVGRSNNNSIEFRQIGSAVDESGEAVLRAVGLL